MRIQPALCLQRLIISLCLCFAAEPGSADDVAFETMWSTQTGAIIYGGVSIDADRLYVGGEDGILRALDRRSGEQAWTFDAESGIASAVSSDDLRVYFHTRRGAVFALDKDSGKEQWQFATQGERRWDYWDYYLSTPVPDDRQVYFGSGDHHVYSVDKRSGQLRWKVLTGNIVHGEPAISGERVIVGGFDGRVYAIDRGTGNTMWTFKTVGNAYFRNGEIPGSASVIDGMVYVGSRDYNVYALLAETGTGAWNHRTPSWVVGRPLAIGDDLYVVNSDGAGVFSYHRVSGKQNWSYTNSHNMFAGAQAVGDSHIAVASLDGRITLLNRSDGSRAAVFETTGSRENRDRFFHDDGKVNYDGIATLEDLSEFYDRQLEQMGGIPGRLAVDEDVIFYATASGEVSAVRVTGLGVTREP